MIHVALELPPDVRPILVNDWTGFGVVLRINNTKGLASVLMQDGRYGEIALEYLPKAYERLDQFEVS